MKLLLDVKNKHDTIIKISLFSSVTVLMMLFVSVNTVYAASHVTVEFDQEVYMPGDTAFITLVDTDGNLDSDLVDSLSVDVWSDSDPGGIDVLLVETGTDTGIFTGEIILTITDESSGNKLRVAIGETITVEAMGASDTAVIGTIPTPSPIIEFDQDSYTPSEIPIITLTDAGSNLDSDLIEIVNVDVFSTTDAGGINTALVETADNTGIFIGNVELTTTDESSGNRLRVSAGDTITTTFEDASDTATINGGGGGCLIATAAYGTELAPQVQFLREIRDNTVMSTTTGAEFMSGFNSLYYSFSPTIADVQRDNPMFKDTVRVLITPMISTLSIMTLAENGSEYEVLGLGMSVIALNLGMYIAAPAAIGFAAHRYIKSRKI